MPTKLGQNFLKNKEIVSKIIQSADLKPDDLVLEIGPGEGALSFEIKKRVNNLIMIEKDRKLAENIARNFKFQILNFQRKVAWQPRCFTQSILNEKKYKFKNGNGIISGDIIKINLHELIKQNNFNNYKVVANIPYYITSPILRMFLESEFPPQEMILMVQKEVAERIVAKPGKMSILATSVQYYARPKILFYVGKDNFDPVPEVDSAVIRITHTAKHVTREERNAFFRIVRAGFSAKRKTLVNNLASIFHLDKKEVENELKTLGILPSARAQELSVDDWKRLADMLK